MNKILYFLSIFLFTAYSVYAQSNCTPIPEVNFPGGRVIMSFDGNVHDDDDIVAMAYSAGLWWAAGLQDKVVQIEYNNHVCAVGVVESDGVGPGRGYDGDNMRTTASGVISNFGYSSSIMYDFEKVANASTNKMASEIEKSTSSNPLWIIAAGPMETIWRGLEKAAKGHNNVTIISHSQWNQDQEDCNNDHNWNDLKGKYQSRGTFFVENCDSGNCSSTSKLNNQNGDFSSAISNWTWMRDSSRNYNNWIFSRNPFNSKFDPSDAGMSYFLITGGPFNGGDKTPDHNNARKLMENPCGNIEVTPTGSAPNLSIISPTQDQTFKIGTDVSVKLDASDDGAIVKYQIFVNNVLVDTDGSSYTPHLLRILKKESYVIRAEVTDNSGSKKVQTVTVNGVDVGESEKSEPKAPEGAFEITSPSDGAVFGVGETITVDLASFGTVIAQHKVFLNNVLVDTDMANFTPYKITNAKAGSYSLKAQVTDVNGKVSVKTIVVTVSNSNEPDKVPQPSNGSTDFEFVTPVDGQNFNTGANLSVNLASSGSRKIVKYEIFINNKLVDTDGANFTPHVVLSPANGTYDIKAKVTAANGSSATKTIVVNVGNSSSAKPTPATENPITLSVSPNSGQTFQEGNTVRVNASASSVSGAIVKYQIFVDGTLVDTDGVNFTPHSIKNITKGDHTVLVEVTDVNGNKKSLTSKIKVNSITSTSLAARLPSSFNNDFAGSTFEDSIVGDGSSFRIEQNPVQSANLKVDLSENMDLTILNLNGVVVKEILDIKDSANVDVSGLAPGMYILKSSTKTVKFIIPQY